MILIALFLFIQCCIYLYNKTYPKIALICKKLYINSELGIYLEASIMSRIRKELVSVPIRVKQELMERIDERLTEDPRFSSRAEYAVYCVMQAYGDVVEDIVMNLYDTKGQRTQDVFDHIVKEKLTEVSDLVSREGSYFNRFNGKPSLIHMRMTEDFIKELDTLCSMLGVKRVDFIKYSLVEFGIMLDIFSFSNESYTVPCIDKSEEHIELNMSDSWRESISEEVESNIKSRSRHRPSGSKDLRFMGISA